MTEVKITYGNIVERCKMLSAFDGQTASDSEGVSRYKELRITDREKELVRGYIEQGVDQLEASLGNGVSIVGVEDAELLSSTEKRRVSNGKVGKSMEEALAAYCLYLWFENKEVDRAASYKQIYADMVEVVRRMVYRKKEPDW